jgi:formylglycine-generating enzyme required for sulfatase activity
MNTENPTQIKKSPRTYRLLRGARGGIWYDIPTFLQASYRHYDAPATPFARMGFRLVRNK